MTEKRAAFNIAFVTTASVFIMGYINAFSLSFAREASDYAWLLDQTMITAQTGNLAWMGKHLAEGNWYNFFRTIMLFLGFVIGNIYGYALKDKFVSKAKQFYFNWISFVLPLVLFPFYFRFIETSVALLILGFAAGTALSCFRQLYHLDINNAMATGSARFFGLWLYEAFMRRARTDKKEVFTFVLFTILVVAFVGGAAIYTLIARLGVLIPNVWSLPGGASPNFYVSELGLLIICIIPMFFAPCKVFTKPKGKYGGGITPEKEKYGGGINTKK